MLYTHTRRNHLLALTALSFGLVTSPATAKNTSGTPIPPVPRFDQKDPIKKGTAIAAYTEAFDSGWVDQYSKSQMTLYDARGDSVKREAVQAILEGTNGDKSIVRFMTPADIRGVAALTHEKVGGTDDSWLYLPASRRVRRISGANRTGSFQGTEFTYEDLTSLSVERYHWKFLKESSLTDAPVFVLEAKPRYRDTGYSRIVLHIHRTHFRAEKLDFFDKAGRRLKTLTSSSWEHAHGRYWRPTKQLMKNHQTGKMTIIEVSQMHLNLALSTDKNGKRRAGLGESLFTRRALEGG